MKVRDLIARLSALRVAGLLDEWGEELAGTLERQAARGQGPTERQRFAAVASRAAFSKRGQRSNVFFKDQHAPKRSATICCRSTRRQRTTPCTARSGPVSTTSASCASCSAERRGRWPFDQLSLSPSGPRSLKRCTQSRSVWKAVGISCSCERVGGPQEPYEGEDIRGEHKENRCDLKANSNPKPRRG